MIEYNRFIYIIIKLFYFLSKEILIYKYFFKLINYFKKYFICFYGEFLGLSLLILYGALIMGVLLVLWVIKQISID